MSLKMPHLKNIKMKIALIFLLSASANLKAEIIPCQDNCVAKVAVPYLVKSVLASSAKPAKILDCPDSGYLVSPILGAAQGSVVSSASIVSGLVAHTQSTVAKLNGDPSHCGSCSEMNTITTFTTSSPQNITPDVNCQSQPVENVRVELDNSEIENYVNQTLSAKNPIGQRLHNNCPKPCSYYVASGQTPISANRSRLNLTVLCGQPRKGSIIFATYDFTVELIQQWTCAK